MSRQSVLKSAIPAALVALGLGVSGCATGDMSDYPSLARRAVERQATVTPTPPTAPMPGPVTATLAEAIRGLARDADAGEAAFRAALASGRSTIESGRGAPVGGENWSQAQLTLSRVDVARGSTTFALAELDRLAVQAGDAGDVSAQAAVGAEQARVAALVAGQQRVIDALLAGLSG
jgi:hypothetical protein